MIEWAKQDFTLFCKDPNRGEFPPSPAELNRRESCDLQA